MGEEELEAIREVMFSGVLTNGRQTAAFESEFAIRHDVAHAVAMANGTVALAAMYRAMGIGSGDEVIVPSMTFISTATSVLHVGATPVFADIDAATFNLDPADVARRVTSRTKAVMAVHYAGHPAPMDELQGIADAAGIALLEDAAEAHGAADGGRPVGGLGKLAMFSFTPTKNMTTGEGGIVTTDDPALAARLRLLRNHGQSSLYRHETLGWNWRMTEMQAAMGRVQLRKLDVILARKRANAAWLTQRLAAVPGVTPPSVRPGAEPVYMLYTVLLDRDRDRVLDYLLAAGIEARVYFPPAHKQPIFVGDSSDLPVTDDVSRRMLSLPMHSLLTKEELGEVAAKLTRAIRRGG